jgi:bacterioferritin-associated ferredoxin
LKEPKYRSFDNHYHYYYDPIQLITTCSEAQPMYVCLCQGVTDSHIRDAIYEGCCSYRDVRESLGVGSQCGKCACLAKQVVRETLSDLQGAQASQAAQLFSPA